MCGEKPVLRNTFIFVTGESFEKEEEKVLYENLIVEKFFWCENPDKFNILIIHQLEDWHEEKIGDIEGQFVVLFIRGVSEEMIVSFKKNVFGDKNCVMFCQDEHKLQNEKIINFTKNSGYFITTEKLSKTHDAYFHEEERPERVKKLFEAPK